MSPPPASDLFSDNDQESGAYRIGYRLQAASGAVCELQLRLHPRTLEQINVAPPAPPSWTELGFHRCRNCPLDDAACRHCPLAVSVVPLVEACKDLQSYEEIDLAVVTPDRRVSARTTVQRALSSLLGLVIATSACPHARYFRPMARFHLPLATEEETIYRAASMYMLAQYFLLKEGRELDADMRGLRGIYADMQLVNAGMAQRLRAVTDQDGAVNAVVLLDLFAKAMPVVLDDSLEELNYLFAAYAR